MNNELSSLPIIDWDAALKLAGNNQDLANDLLGLLIKNLPSDLAEIQKAHATNNEQELKQLLHKLRGGVAYCGVPRLKAILVALETELKSDSRHHLPALLEQLNQEATVLIQFNK